MYTKIKFGLFSIILLTISTLTLVVLGYMLSNPWLELSAGVCMLMYSFVMALVYKCSEKAKQKLSQINENL